MEPHGAFSPTVSLIGRDIETAGGPLYGPSGRNQIKSSNDRQVLNISREIPFEMHLEILLEIPLELSLGIPS